MDQLLKSGNHTADSKGARYCTRDWKTANFICSSRFFSHITLLIIERKCFKTLISNMGWRCLIDASGLINFCTKCWSWIYFCDKTNDLRDFFQYSPASQIGIGTHISSLCALCFQVHQTLVSLALETICSCNLTFRAGKQAWECMWMLRGRRCSPGCWMPCSSTSLHLRNKPCFLRWAPYNQRYWI